MIRTILELRSIAQDVIKVAEVTDPNKTEGKRLFALVGDILDSMNDLVEKQGLSLSNSIEQKETDIINQVPSIVQPLLPDLTVYRLKTDDISYTILTNKPTLFDGVWTSITGKPLFFSGNYIDLVGKPSLFSGSYLDLTNKPAIFNGDYNSLINKPTIPTIPVLSVNAKTGIIVLDKTDIGLSNVDNISDVNKPISTATQTALNLKATTSTLSTVATSGSYLDLANRPSFTKLLWNQTSSVQVNNTVTETDILITGNGSLNFDVSPSIGSCYRIRGRGLFSTQAITSPTLTVKLYLGTTVIAQVAVASFLAGASNRTFSFDTEVLVTASNVVYAQGYFNYYAALSDLISTTPLLNGIGVSTVVDLSTVKQLRMTYTWSAANTSNQISTKIANFEKLN